MHTFLVRCTYWPEIFRQILKLLVKQYKFCRFIQFILYWLSEFILKNCIIFLSTKEKLKWKVTIAHSKIQNGGGSTSNPDNPIKGRAITELGQCIGFQWLSFYYILTGKNKSPYFHPEITIIANKKKKLSWIFLCLRRKEQKYFD